jgi:hypothetical protein
MAAVAESGHLQAASRLSGLPLAWPRLDMACLLLAPDGRLHAAATQATAELVELCGGGLYLAANHPHAVVRSTLERAGTPTGELTVLDCITGIGGYPTAHAPGLQFVESPMMLEKLLLRADHLVRRMPPGRRFLVVDSLATLAAYNGADAVTEFAHGLVVRMRALAAPLALVAQDRDGGVGAMVRPFCDLVRRVP